jgi:hypothetical protein
VISSFIVETSRWGGGGGRVCYVAYYSQNCMKWMIIAVEIHCVFCKRGTKFWVLFWRTSVFRGLNRCTLNTWWINNERLKERRRFVVCVWRYRSATNLVITLQMFIHSFIYLFHCNDMPYITVKFSERWKGWQENVGYFCDLTSPVVYHEGL